MPYLFHTENGFSLIHSTAKNGVFYQSFTSPYSTKPIQIFPQNTANYSACMDASNNLCVAVSPDPFHLNYYTYENNRFIKNVLVANQNSNYMLSYPVVYNLPSQNTFSIVYLSHQAHTEIYKFIIEIPCTHQQTSLLTLSTNPYLIKSYLTNDSLWIFFITSDTCYHLQALQITDKQPLLYTYIHLNEPIIDYSICINEELVHITYVSELHGKYQLSYFNPSYKTLTHLLITPTPCNPAVFSYYNMIWIHVMLSHHLQMMLSIDYGQSFSNPTPCSIQNNVCRSFFFTQKISPFVGQELYASIASTPKLCTLAMIDFPKFHSDSRISPELELLIEGFLLSLENTKMQPSIQVGSDSYHNSSTQKTPSTDDTLSVHNLNTPSLEQAKANFMQDLAGWDLQPKL